MWLVTIGWVVLILALVVGITLGFTVVGPEVGVPAIIGAVVVLVFYGGVVEHYLGIRRKVERHLGPGWEKGELLTHPIPRHTRVDTQLALDALRTADPGGRVFGVHPPYLSPGVEEDSGTDTLVTIAQRNPRPQPLRYARLPASQTETYKVAENALCLLRLPDRDDRRRLFGVFGRKLDLSGVDVEALLDRTDGASPAFLAELFRKAVVLADERGERSDPLRMTDADFTGAVRELVEFGGELTRNLLGYKASPER